MQANPLRLLDALCTFAFVGDCVGRLGCHFYGCCFGRPILQRAAAALARAANPGGEEQQPAKQRPLTPFQPERPLGAPAAPQVRALPPLCLSLSLPPESALSFLLLFVGGTPQGDWCDSAADPSCMTRAVAMQDAHTHTQPAGLGRRLHESAQGVTGVVAFLVRRARAWCPLSSPALFVTAPAVLMCMMDDAKRHLGDGQLQSSTPTTGVTLLLTLLLHA